MKSHWIKEGIGALDGFGFQPLFSYFSSLNLFHRAGAEKASVSIKESKRDLRAVAETRQIHGGAVSIKERKRDLRAFYKKRLSRLSSAGKAQKQKEIIRFLRLLPFFKERGLIAGFKALSDEPCLDDFFKSYQSQICFPAVSPKGLVFYRPSGQWRQNGFSVREPQPLLKNRAPLSSLSCCFLPARAFDRKGCRLGRGGGFYDKTFFDRKARLRGCFPYVGDFTGEAKPLKSDSLAESSSHRALKARALGKNRPLLIGIAFAEQIHNEDLPFEGHDAAVDMIVTDRFVLMPCHKL